MTPRTALSAAAYLRLTGATLSPARRPLWWVLTFGVVPMLALAVTMVALVVAFAVDLAVLTLTAAGWAAGALWAAVRARRPAA